MPESDPRAAASRGGIVPGWRWRDLAAVAAITAVTAAILLWMGRVPICTCGYVRLWHGAIDSPETSQQLLDPYTFTHILHGILFYGAGSLIFRATGRRITFGVALILATLVEGAWEVVENLPAVIARYREATIAIGYTGDSVLNSVGDILSMIAGFWLASRIPVAASAIIVVATELILLWLVRDNLTLQMLLMITPIDAVKQWQMGAGKG